MVYILFERNKTCYLQIFYLYIGGYQGGRAPKIEAFEMLFVIFLIIILYYIT